MKRIRILIVDDSSVVRRVLTQELEKQPDFHVVGSAVDPYVARDRIVELEPDVITLDIEMPRMDGLEFLERLMRYRPTPVVIVSSLAPEGSAAAMRALTLGAVDIIAKPNNQYSTPDMEALCRAVRAASCSRPRASQAMPVARRSRTPRLDALRTTDKLVAIGASTGGPAAVEEVLSSLPPTTPGVLVVQHMPVGVTRPFAERLAQISSLVVREARDGDLVSPGVALIAPGGVHMTVVRSGTQMIVRLKDGPRIHYQRPSVDVLFHSVAQHAGPNAVGVVLTGMGEDGAAGLAAMHQAGARTIAESEESCVIFGMPRAAIAAGAVDRVLPLARVAEAIVQACS